MRAHSRRIDAVFERAIGSVLIDRDGRRYIDFLAGGGVLAHGHNDPDMVAALAAHLQQQGLSAGPDLHSPVKLRFLQRLAQRLLAPRGLHHQVQFTGPSPGDAVDAAVKLARKITGRQTVVVFSHSHHGDSPSVAPGADAMAGGHGMGLRHTTWRAAYDGLHGPATDTSAQLARLLDDPSAGVEPPAAILVETVQAEGGLRCASAAWLAGLAAIARRHRALLIVDDSQAGGGRAGGYFSFEGSGVVPDLVVMPRSVSGFGLPMGLLLVRPDRDRWRPAEHASAFQHHHHGFVTGTVMIEKYWSDDRFARTVARRGELVAAALAQTADAVPGAEPRGRGMMRGLALRDAELADRVVRRCLSLGLVIGTCGAAGEVLRVMAPLNTPTLLLEQGLALLHRAVTEEAGVRSRSAPHRALARVHATAREGAAAARSGKLPRLDQVLEWPPSASTQTAQPARPSQGSQESQAQPPPTAAWPFSGRAGTARPVTSS